MVMVMIMMMMVMMMMMMMMMMMIIMMMMIMVMMVMMMMMITDVAKRGAAKRLFRQWSWRGALANTTSELPEFGPKSPPPVELVWNFCGACFQTSFWNFKRKDI